MQAGRLVVSMAEAALPLEGICWAWSSGKKFTLEPEGSPKRRVWEDAGNVHRGGQKSDTGWGAKLADVMVEELKLTSETVIRPVERGALVLAGKGVCGKEIGNPHRCR